MDDTDRRVAALAREITELSEVQEDHSANLDHYGDPPDDAYTLARRILEVLGDEEDHDD